ncbi:446de36d-d1cc-4328-b8cf-7af3e9558fc5 [Sclerotinia trifoliorum]|uniref:446de36d-d1cc-4328-b8cf-7af3e9558fc5 n=1 Tax=Sclerotinia trifoliorum TaxID=28548 RepID=A0A8H2VMS6_9HELO|nr:446de36d-d1cc-4328-b8cf-7af3e9558fc5 [Sclerotinia trifoliorum]
MLSTRRLLSSIPRTSSFLKSKPKFTIRTLATEIKSFKMSSMNAMNTKQEGDISSVFASLSGTKATPLPERFADIKRNLIRGHEEAVQASFTRLIDRLAVENRKVAELGPKIIPSVAFRDIVEKNVTEEQLKEMRDKGSVVIRGVVDEKMARGYKEEVENYVKSNPSTKGFPANDPQVFELYWSPPQVKARGHPNMIAAQKFLINLWHSSDPNSPISFSQPVVYADRVRIRQPGDAVFALGPHADGGSVERWEPNGYGIKGVYDSIFQGKWEEFDPFESSSRVPAVSDLYNGGGSCSMFRMFQAWLGMSHTAPGEGTLKVNPLIQLTTAYFLLRPFFEPIKELPEGKEDQYTAEFLSPENWRLIPTDKMTTALHGATPSQGQEMTEKLHPHLDLKNTMIHIPKINPGDYVAWHCDMIHAVDKTHAGKSDSSVLYIPACPLTPINAEALARQRDTFLAGVPGPDFPGGKGESEHIGRPGLEELEAWTGEEGLRAMGLSKFIASEKGAGVEEAVKIGNEYLGF